MRASRIRKTRLSDRVEEYAGTRGDRGIADIVTTGDDEQIADPSTDPATATTHQRTTLTPAGSPTAPAGTDSAIDRGLVEGIVIGVVITALVTGAVAPFVEVRMLAITALVLPTAAAWFMLQKRMDGRRGNAPLRSARQPRRRPRAASVESRAGWLRTCSSARSSR